MHDYSARGRYDLEEFNAYERIRMSGESGWIPEQNFSTIHLVVLGLDTSQTLEAELEKNPEAINAKDARNRTALDWATARANLDQMDLLIRHGSDVNNMDLSGRTTLLHAVDSHSSAAVLRLLDAGANPNLDVPREFLRSSPLKAACSGGLPEMVALLLRHGAKVNTCNPEGQTPLHAAAIRGQVDCVTMVLEAGASVEQESANGLSPLDTAIVTNSHAVLPLLVERWTKHVTAKTILIISHGSPRPSLDPKEFDATRVIIKGREDFNRDLFQVFEYLLLRITNQG